MTTTRLPNAYDLLAERGLIFQATHEDLRHRLAEPTTAYNGFDPTADSLHVGHLLPIMGLAHLQRCGHRPIVVIGGATAMVGDPSGKTQTRQMLSRSEIDRNAEAIGRQIAGILDFDDPQTGAVMLNNADWLGGITWIDMLRDLGPHFSVNRMLSMESVKGRLESGITYLEFSYMVMQAYDFLHLYREHGCTLQTGGQDQWGNIVMGMELGRRLESVELLGMTYPLVTRADGGKFGKTEAGTVWLDPARTSPYEFYQFFRNVADADVGKFLGYFTFLPMEAITEQTAEGGAALNRAKETLAYEVTKLIHGREEADRARDSARKAFSQADVTGEAIPNAPLSESELAEGIPIVKLMTQAGLAGSNGEARRLIQNGGVRVHEEKVTDHTRRVTADDIADGYVLLRVGKKKLFRFDVGQGTR